MGESASNNFGVRLHEVQGDYRDWTMGRQSLPREVAGDPDSGVRFEREARAASLAATSEPALHAPKLEH